MQRLHIGMDFREGFRENPRGIGLYCRHLMREYAAIEPEMDIELYHERNRPPDMPEIPAFMRPNLLQIKGARFQTWERLGLPLRLASDGVRLYHGTFNTLPPKLPLIRAPKTVVTMHDIIVTWLDQDLDDPWVRYARKVTPRVLRQATAVLTVSEFSKRDIVRRFGTEPDKIQVVHNGIHPIFHEDAPDDAVAAVREKYANGRPYLFAIGSALQRKNGDALFPLIKQLRERGSLEDALLVMSGLSGQALADRTEAARRSGVEEHVRLLGYLSWEELRALYSGAELSIYPSLAEGWGIPVVESLACGTPVATSNNTGMAEAGAEHACYFDPKDIASIVTSVEQALKERASFARGKTEAQARARTFSWRRCAEDTLAVFRELCR